MRVQPDARNPFPDEPRILLCRHGIAGPPAPGEQKVSGPLAGHLEVIVNGLAGLLRQLEPYRMPRLSLPHRRPCECIAGRGQVFQLHTDQIAAPQLAVDGKIEHGIWWPVTLHPLRADEWQRGRDG